MSKKSHYKNIISAMKAKKPLVVLETTNLESLDYLASEIDSVLSMTKVDLPAVVIDKVGEVDYNYSSIVKWDPSGVIEKFNKETRMFEDYSDKVRKLYMDAEFLKKIGEKSAANVSLADPTTLLYLFENEDFIKESLFILIGFDLFLSKRDVKSNPFIHTFINVLKKASNEESTFLIPTPYRFSNPDLDRFIFNYKYELDEEVIKQCLVELLKNNFAETKLDENVGTLKLEPKEVSEETLNTIVRSLKGLNLVEIKDAVLLSLASTRFKKIDLNVIREYRQERIKEKYNIDFTYSDLDFSHVKGMENLKFFCKKMIQSGNAKGILLLGVPGSGKSHIAKCLGNEVNLPTITLNFGELQSKFVGETESNTRNLLNAVDEIGDSIVFMDEIEKALAGMSGHNGDSGTSKRQGGQLLTWLNDKKNGFVIATANDISALPPELLRAERWDGIFFVDVPDSETLEALCDQYAEVYDKDYKSNMDKGSLKEFFLELKGYTGAEVKQLFRISKSLEIPVLDALKYVKPISITMGPRLESLREFAKNNCIEA